MQPRSAPKALPAEAMRLSTSAASSSSGDVLARLATSPSAHAWCTRRRARHDAAAGGGGVAPRGVERSGRPRALSVRDPAAVHQAPPSPARVQQGVRAAAVEELEEGGDDGVGVDDGAAVAPARVRAGDRVAAHCRVAAARSLLLDAPCRSAPKHAILEVFTMLPSACRGARARRARLCARRAAGRSGCSPVSRPLSAESEPPPWRRPRPARDASS